MIGARGNGKSTLSAELITAIVRADVYQYFDWATNELHLVSRNSEAPLTDKEKELIRVHLGIHMVPYKLIFDN